MRSPYAIHRPVENEVLVRQRDRRLLRELLAVLAAVIALGGGLLAYTWVHLETLDTGYRVNAREKELHQLLETERRRRLEVSVLTHPQRIETRARQDLEMRPPTLEQTVFYQELAR